MKKYLIVFLISMVPLIELRGAIPYAVGFDLPIVPSIIVALVGNMLPVPFIFLFARSWFGVRTRKSSADSATGVLRKVKKVAASLKRKQEWASIWLCCSL